jgi:hypothetical protein
MLRRKRIAGGRARPDQEANGRKSVPMQRICSIVARMGLVLLGVFLTAPWSPVRGDLIRPKPARSFPDIAGDIVGKQTYTYDPITRTGKFALVNAPFVIALGPSIQQMVHMLPDADGTLSQSLKFKLDCYGRLVDSPDNNFQIRGTVVIGDRTYRGLLLQGKPTAFGAEFQGGQAARNPEVFDLDMRITGGELAEAFGAQAYLRIVPQSKSTFTGQFTSDFSSERPLTNLRASRGRFPRSVPEPSALLTLLTCGAGLLVCRLRRHLRRSVRPRARGSTVVRTSRPCAASTVVVPR